MKYKQGSRLKKMLEIVDSIKGWQGTFLKNPEDWKAGEDQEVPKILAEMNRQSGTSLDMVGLTSQMKNRSVPIDLEGKTLWEAVQSMETKDG